MLTSDVCGACRERHHDLLEQERRRAYLDWLRRAPVLNRSDISGRGDIIGLDEATELCMRAEMADTWFYLGGPSWKILAGGHHRVLRKRHYSNEWEGWVEAGSVYRTPDGNVIFVWRFLNWFDDGR
ncbi:hypothetical protein [Micromonospora sp. NPDC000018]|uniref:hypothetical protein n=1 Tax=Micromonospora sp. NPDC000018 TaxID=3154239 RepID=UPI0033274795